MGRKKFSDLNEKQKLLIESFFKLKNLLYLTKANKRKFTLYFGDGKHVGRIRQEHSTGKKVKISPRNVRIFAFKKISQEKIYEKLKNYEGKTFKEFETKENTMDLFELKPMKNFFQIEINIDKEGKIKKGGHHKSSGNVVKENKEFNDKKISEIIEEFSKLDEKIFEIKI